MPKKTRSIQTRAVHKLEEAFEVVLTLRVTEGRVPRRVVLEGLEKDLRELRFLLRELEIQNPDNNLQFWKKFNKVFEKLMGFITKGLLAPLVCKLSPLRRIEGYMMQIGKTIKLLRVWTGLKQKELAENLGVSATYLSALENDKREPSLSLLKGLSQQLNVPVGLLLVESMDDFRNMSPSERAKYDKLKDLLLDIQRLRMTQTEARESTITYAEEVRNTGP